ncbi:MAG: proline--tRNA ligase [Planctomycetota bacterium]|jgi:prolyl-tRNA synthetase
MPTFWTKTLIPTLREDPSEAEVPSHRLMLRAGLVRQVSAGIYTYLPLGWRALHKAIEIIRQEMDAAGASELFMPAVEPIELLTETRRDADYGDDLFRLRDRRGHVNALAPTHEEVITDAMRAFVESYRQLPLNLYQIQSKYRDEPRPRFGVLRSREFMMKDAYSFHLTVDGPGGLDETYDRMYDAYCRIFDRCGLSYEVVEAESGPIGGSASHEFMVICETGEDTVLKSDKANYAANVEKCEIGPRDWSFDGPPTGDLEVVHTPHLPAINDVAAFLEISPDQMLKTLVCDDGDGWVLAVLRGDHDLNEGKLRGACGAQVALADDQAAQAAGFAIGFVSPAVIKSVAVKKMFIDPDAAQPRSWVTGADKIDYHVRDFNWRRDVGGALDGETVTVADIRNADDGDPSPKSDGGILRAVRGIEVGHVFKLGTKYSDAMGFTVLDEKQRQRPVIMGCYGIGPGRILAAAIETSHDADGIVWPPSIAPYSVQIVPIKYEAALCKTCDDLAKRLEAAGLDVLLDDRSERPGVKFKDADLVGCPVRLTVSDKTLATDSVELKLRAAGRSKAELVRLADAVTRCAGTLGDSRRARP